jgi:AraC family transcriptional regulator
MDKIRAQTGRVGAGGGAFTLPRLTLGVFHTSQPTHRLALGTDRRSVLPLMQDQGWILPAGSAGFCEYDSDLDVTTVEFDDALVREVGLAPGDPNLQRVGAHDPLLLHFALGAQVFTKSERLYRQTMEQAFALHLAQTLRPMPREEAAVDDQRLRRAVAFIHDNLSKDISLDDLAVLATMSPFHFARAFKAAKGASPLQYVIRARLERAQVLLRSTRLSVAEIAYQVGYQDISRFGQHFKRQTGVTPGAWRAG